MYRVYTKISFVQQSSEAYPFRNNTLIYNFVNQFESTDSWADFTNSAKITLPKNVFVRDKNNQLIPLGGTNVNLGGFSINAPLFLRGDGVEIESGYRYFNSLGMEILTSSVLFQGYISMVTSKKPVILDCEDNMWKLKQLIAPNKVFPASKYKLEDILKELLAGTPFTVNTLTNTSFGDFRTQNETVCEVLARLRKDYHFESYFRGNELRCGAIVYIEADAIADGKKVFRFQQNIISDELEYRRKDDINLSAIAYSINKNELTVLTKKGKKKTKRERLEILVSSRNGTFIRTPRVPGTKADYAPNTAGERRTLYFWNVPDLQTLGDLAEKELTKYYYTGFKGKFTTFGIPYVRQGDNVDILDPVLPERNGRYKAKSVHYTGGKDGLRQVIELDYLITRLDEKGNPL
jgi:hypothetical protein